MSKINFVFGSLSVSIEGKEDWLAKQLDKLLNVASELNAPDVTFEHQAPLQINRSETHKLIWLQNPDYYKKRITGSFTWQLRNEAAKHALKMGG
jgi:hypothetical protein